jgi:hypothetical protein
MTHLDLSSTRILRHFSGVGFGVRTLWAAVTCRYTTKVAAAMCGQRVSDRSRAVAQTGYPRAEAPALAMHADPRPGSAAAGCAGPGIVWQAQERMASTYVAWRGAGSRAAQGVGLWPSETEKGNCVGQPSDGCLHSPRPRCIRPRTRGSDPLGRCHQTARAADAGSVPRTGTEHLSVLGGSATRGPEVRGCRGSRRKQERKMLDDSDCQADMRACREKHARPHTGRRGGERRRSGGGIGWCGSAR